MSPKTILSLLRPSSIAVIGASTEPGTVGNDIARNLLGSRDGKRIFLVNPKTDRLLGEPCYPDIAAVGIVPDLAVIVVPAAIVPEVLRQAGEVGVPAAIVISAGFRETGSDGAVLETEISAIAERYGMSLLGPNCLGFLDPIRKLNASFAPRLPRAGGVAFFSQSGALMTAMLDMTENRIGFSAVISTGNKTALDETGLITFFRDDERTETISFYTESIASAPTLIALGREIARSDRPKPIIALKSGRTESGRKASISHTGALAGSDASYEALFRQARIVRAGDMRSFLDAITVFSENPVPLGNRVAIVTNAGGPGVLAADAAAEAGLSMPSLSGSSLLRLRDSLPKAAGIGNPIDILGDARSDRYRLATDTAAGDPNVDALLVIVTPQSMTEAAATAEAIVEARDRHGKPVLAVLAGGKDLETADAVLREAGISRFTVPEEAARALSLLSRVAAWHAGTYVEPTCFTDIDRDAARHIIDTVRREGRTRLYEYETYGVLRAYGFPLLRSHLVRNAEEAEEAAKKIGGNVALKIVSPDIIHKTDAGGVMIDVAREAVAEAYVDLLSRVRSKHPEAALEGALVMEMAPRGGKEIIVGAKREAGLGTVLLFGMGGIYTEAIRDVAFRFAPVTRTDAEEMFSELRSVGLLSGIRGERGIDREALFSVMERLSLLVGDFPEIEELDINPYFAFPDGNTSVIADARIALSETDV